MNGEEIVRRLAGAHRGTVHETHGSWVVVTADRAWKVKKPVRWSFLDYTTLEARRRACEQEVAVNRVLAPHVYLGVRPVVDRDGEPALGGPGEDAAAIEWIVEMRRFDEEMTLASQVRDGRADDADVAAVARKIAAFHARAEVVAPDDPAGAIADRISADLDDLEAIEEGGGAELADRLRPVAAAIVAREAGVIEQRARDGHVRDGHGDLRADHVLLSYGMPIVDRLEFDRALRVADVADDLAFLAMDLESRGARWAADRLVASYAEAGGAVAPPTLAAAFAWRRAIVRVKTALLSGDRDAATQLLGLADALAWRSRAGRVLAVCGPPASGKSTLAHELSSLLELHVLSSDRVRKELLGVPEHERAGEAAYAEDVTARVYAELAARARSTLAHAPGVILDATFGAAAERAALERELDREVGWIWCDPPEDVLRERAEQRMHSPQRISDADVAVALRLAAEFEPLEGDRVLRLTGESLGAGTLDTVAGWLDGRPVLPGGA